MFPYLCWLKSVVFNTKWYFVFNHVYLQMETEETPPTWKRYTIMNFCNISLIQNEILWIPVHCRPDITRMSGSTTSDRVISESRYTEVFYYVTNGIHDQERIFPWQCDVYTKNKSRVDCFSACLLFILAISRSSFRCRTWIMKSTVSQQISYEIGVHTQTALYRIPRYIGSRYIGSTVYFVILCILCVYLLFAFFLACAHPILFSMKVHSIIFFLFCFVFSSVPH